MKTIRHQAGVVLPVSLFILLIVTILTVSTMDTSSTGLRITFNKQAQMQAKLLSMQRVEQILSDPDWFTPTALGGATWPAPGPYGGAGQHPDADTRRTVANSFQVDVTKPRCVGSIPASGYSVQVKFPPEETFWEFDVIVQDQISGGRMVTTQGVKMRMINGVCYHPPYAL